MGSIPVDFEIEGLHETQSGKRKTDGRDNVTSSHVLSRRRAQNRVSQRAFRSRKQKRMKEMEEELTTLQERHNELAKSYEALQMEYSLMKQQLGELQNNYEYMSAASRIYLPDIEWNALRATPSDMLNDSSAYEEIAQGSNRREY